jgi:hypothetical protein
MINYTITLTEAENKALGIVAYDQQEWIENAVKERCRIAMEEVFQSEVAKMLADPNTTSIPADREQVVLDADIQSAKEVMDAPSPSLLDI